ncbi:MAG: enoyl-CoA hydratase/isomerase family protein [Alphaproteobacteria bacterium]|nr:enoyl-CoA hydratase/isomerase family protein [Alphaproteobacteria bacterium]
MLDLIVKDQIAFVTLARPEKHNAFDDQLILKFSDILEKLQKDVDIRILVLTSEGPNFSSGADLNWMQKMAHYNKDDNFKDAQALARLMHLLYHFPKPTLVKVQGMTLGGGVGLIAACDIAIADEQASFALSEVKLGLIPAVISPYVISVMGARAARRYFLTGEFFSAQEALRWGLLHQLASLDELDSILNDLIIKLKKAGPYAQIQAKKLILDLQQHYDTPSLHMDMAERIASIRISSEGQEGLNAFLNKRSPSWIKEIK